MRVLAKQKNKAGLRKSTQAVNGKEFTSVTTVVACDLD